MTAPDPKAVYRRFITEAFMGDLDALDTVLDPEYVDHDAPAGLPPGPAGVKQLIGPYRIAFPDVHITIEMQVVEGDLVSTRYTLRGTHRGDLMGIPPTGKTVTMAGMTIARVRDGKMTEGWVTYDALGLLQQIGVVGAPTGGAG